MFSLLFKKQFHEMFRAFFYDQRKGKLKSGRQIAGFTAIIALILISFFAMAFGLGMGMAQAFVPVEMDWFFFLLLIALTIIAGTFGTAFTTFASLYKTKDNEALLAMPIPVKDIVASRLVGVYVVGTLYCALVYFPFLLAYWISAPFNIHGLICQLILFLALSLVVFTLSCLLGFLIAKASLHIKNKGIITLVIGVFFMALYLGFYIFVQPRMAEIITLAVEHGDEIKASVGVLYDLGYIGLGGYIPCLIVMGATLVAFGLTVLLLIKSYISIVTSSDKYKKTIYALGGKRNNSLCLCCRED